MKNTMHKLMALVLSLVMALGITIPAFAVEPELDEAAKLAYYEEYTEIVAEVYEETGAVFVLLPFEEIKDSNDASIWISPEEYRDLLLKWANAEWVAGDADSGIIPSDIITFSDDTKDIPSSPVVERNTTVDGREYTIEITFSFITGRTINYGQEFFIFKSLTACSSRCTSSFGKWTQSMSLPDYNFTSDHTLCTAALSGTLSVNGSTGISKIFYFNFGVNSMGRAYEF